MRKIILYPHSAMKPIILSDSGTENIDSLKQRIMTCLSEPKITILETETDSLIIRPSEIQAVLITDKEDHDIDGNPKNTTYDKRLVIAKPEGTKK